MHLFASRNVCPTLTWRKLLRSDLQSLRGGRKELLTTELDCTKSTTILASSSTSISCIPSWEARIRPSLRAQNSAIVLVANPTDLEKPFTHPPEQFLINPPAPVAPGFPREAPSVLSFIQPVRGFSHLTGIKTLYL